MKSIPSYWLIVVFAIGIAATYIFLEYIYIPTKTVSVSKRTNYDVVTLTLPNDHDPDVFGPEYWEAYHKLTSMIPCPACRSKAGPFMRFFHDVVNKSTDKPFFDKENYDKHIKEFKNA